MGEKSALTLRRPWLWGGIAAVMLLGGIVASIATSAPDVAPESTIDQIVDEALAGITPGPAHSAEVFARITPSLVIVVADSGGEADGSGLGSGVIINDDGSILTAFHVIAGAETIEVTFADGTRSTAVVDSAEPENDMAVLIAANGPDVVVPAVIASHRQMRVGDEAFAVGNPLGLTASLSAGVISGFERTIPIGDDQQISGLIQFDAAVNPGNSGGPLLNRAGQVVGIVTALANPANETGFSGIGFAVPIGTALSGAAGAPGQ